jgi:hypothetical protein
MAALAFHVRPKIIVATKKIVQSFLKSITSILKLKLCLNVYILGIEGIKVRFRAHMRVKEKSFDKFNQSWSDQMKFLSEIEKKMCKQRPEFEVTISTNKFHTSLKKHIFNIYWNSEMKKHMKARLELKIRQGQKSSRTQHIRKKHGELYSFKSIRYPPP